MSVSRITSRDDFLAFLRRYGAWGYVDDTGKRRKVRLIYRNERATCTLDLLSRLCDEGLIYCFPGNSYFELSPRGRNA